ncbi:hypothetical protein FOL47_004124, partial [Perkinsus chesapeaki]
EQCQTKRRALEFKSRPVRENGESHNEVSAVSLEALIDSGSTVSIIDIETLSSLPTSVQIDMDDAPGCKTAAGHQMRTLGSIVLSLGILSRNLTAKFYVTDVSLIHPVIIGRDILAEGGFVLRFNNNQSIGTDVAAVSGNGEQPQRDLDWRKLPPNWQLQEVVFSSNELYIATATPSSASVNQKARFYVGFNPFIISPASHSEQLRAQRPHNKLRESSVEAKQAAE